MNPLKKLFGPKISPFLVELGKRHLWVVNLNQSNAPGFRFGEVSKEELRERLDRQVEETAGDQPRRLFEYDKKGHHILPVFSSTETTVQWMKKKPFSLDSQMLDSQMVAFTQMRMQTLVLFAKLRHCPSSTYVMLDPETPDERELTPIEIRRTLEHFRR